MPSNNGSGKGNKNKQTSAEDTPQQADEVSGDNDKGQDNGADNNTGRDSDWDEEDWELWRQCKLERQVSKAAVIKTTTKSWSPSFKQGKTTIMRKSSIENDSALADGHSSDEETLSGVWSVEKSGQSLREKMVKSV